ncbi:phosphatidate cytidylyltransferase, partial [Mycobacterium sp. CBMA361]|nr:phosphatidate cytidylyltransferase [Mycolicibacterium sp. CBMA 361]
MATDTAPTGEPKKTSRAGRNLPAAISVGAVLGGTVISTLLWAPQLWVALVALAIALAT